MKSEAPGNVGAVQSTFPAAINSVTGVAEAPGTDNPVAATAPHMVQHANMAVSGCEGFVPPPKFHELPPDALGKIFELLATDPNFSRALTSLSRTGKEFNRLIADFVNNYAVKDELGSAKSAQRQMWKAQAGFIKERAGEILGDFGRSQKMLAGMSVAGAESFRAQLNELDGVELRFQDSPLDPAAMVGLLSTVEGKVIKLNAKGMGRDRFLNEVMPALKAVNPGCQIVLDASENQLAANDLKPLLDYMSTHPCIYRLDLSGNTLCGGSDCSAAVLQLFEFAGPLTHLSLCCTGLNDATVAGLNEVIAGAPLLAKLDLQGNQLTEEGAIAVMTALAPASETGRQAVTTIRQVQLTDNAYERSDSLQKVCTQACTHLLNAARSDPEISAQGSDYLSPLYLFRHEAVFDLGKSSDNGTVAVAVRACHYELDEVDTL